MTLRGRRLRLGEQYDDRRDSNTGDEKKEEACAAKENDKKPS
jgi:hypothetical protein